MIDIELQFLSTDFFLYEPYCFFSIQLKFMTKLKGFSKAMPWRNPHIRNYFPSEMACFWRWEVFFYYFDVSFAWSVCLSFVDIMVHATQIKNKIMWTSSNRERFVMFAISLFIEWFCCSYWFQFCKWTLLNDNCSS